MAKFAAKAKRAAPGLILGAALAFAAPMGAHANPSMSGDFQNMMEWLSHEMAQGLGFTAGDTFDPPHEVTDKRLQPDLSIGVGHLPLDRSKFPEPQTPALRDLGVGSIFPKAVNFPNLAMHLRAGLPYRMDFAVRGANMTTPPGYKISANAPAKGQSNSIGFSLRKHFLGGEDLPLVSLGFHYNHVYGIFNYNTKFSINNVNGFSADSNVAGAIQWNINSLGLNAVASQTFGHFTPFFGFGYNRVSGSVRASLLAIPDTPLIAQISGESSQKPEQNQGRLIFGSEMNRSWIHMFFNTEIKAMGIGSGKSYMIHAGAALPFHIGTGSGAAYASSTRWRRAQAERFEDTRETSGGRDYKAPRPEKATTYQPARPPAEDHKEMFGGPKAEKAETEPPLIFIQ
ncbi:MAG: hypothetical protein HY077_07165 [Elusimicrobia bacterium]|nr:hypothetical protein [Elusimicrobiota bacterium]